MTKKCTQILDDLCIDGTTEGVAVSNCLRAIAENGDEQAEDEYLVGCAEEIRDWAKEFINRMRS